MSDDDDDDLVSRLRGRPAYEYVGRKLVPSIFACAAEEIEQLRRELRDAETDSGAQEREFLALQAECENLRMELARASRDIRAVAAEQAQQRSTTPCKAWEP